MNFEKLYYLVKGQQESDMKRIAELQKELDDIKEFINGEIKILSLMKKSKDDELTEYGEGSLDAYTRLRNHFIS